MSEVRELTENRKKKAGSGEGIILVIYFILKPLYLFSSGLPQISDIFLFSAALYLFIKDRFKAYIPNSYLKWVFVFFVSLIYQIVVQSVWWLVTDDNKMILTVLYYLFNFSAVLVCIRIGHVNGIEDLKLALCRGCFYSSIVTAIGFLLNIGSGIRATSFFNNPNQLGYYAVLVMSVIAFFPDQLPKWQNAVTLIIAAWANIVSLSKASIIASAALALMYTVWGIKGRTLKKTVLQLLLLIAFFSAVYWFLYSDSTFITERRPLYLLRRRIMNLSVENDSQLGSGRGYDRVFEMGIHFLWGMGEGAFGRFRSLPGLEVHSTYLNLLISYGLFGFMAYMWLIGNAFFSKGRLNMRNIACLSGVLLYGLTHNGIRNTLLWILIAAVIQAGGGSSDKLIDPGIKGF
ncbi:MAG: hypothetical protein IKR03_01540 [Clostridia bacterium]|nr:hypothetical protein [Christensenellaceae bacterium]MBR6239441.1 hypothetical protein [Clostridia bacterium]